MQKLVLPLRNQNITLYLLMYCLRCKETSYMSVRSWLLLKPYSIIFSLYYDIYPSNYANEKRNRKKSLNVKLLQASLILVDKVSFSRNL